ncbi:hypothetical protein X727_29335 [Mesorhizobium sp. L103C119B0]|nr:hypothetical protein X727_29335 [Mesorhizobium sp. L103C119B0]
MYSSRLGLRLMVQARSVLTTLLAEDLGWGQMFQEEYQLPTRPTHAQLTT